MRRSLALVGCGKMGQALLKGWLAENLDVDITVIQPDPLHSDFTESLPPDRFEYLSAPPENRTFDLLFFALKPQVLETVCTTYIGMLKADGLIVSIAAGKSIATFERLFGKNTAIIRTMPNTPAAIGQGISALLPNKNVTDTHKDMAQSLFEVSGDTLWISDEAQMDAVTAISGSGPAYLFYFIEAFTQAAMHLGFEEEVATRLARQTIIGAAALAWDEPTLNAATLRENVTSPGGTTAAALEVLMDGRWQQILNDAAHAAKRRSEELA